MNILYVTGTYKPSINGVAVSVEKFKEELESRGHNVYVLAPSTISGGKVEGDDEHIIRYPAVVNPMVDDYPIPMAPISLDRFNELRNIDIDIVHSHHPYYIAYFASRYAYYWEVPYVMTHHTKYSEYSDIYLKFLPPQIKKIISETSIEDQFAKANFVITPSNAIKDELLESIPYLEVEKIPTGIDHMQRSTLSKRELRERLNLPVDKKILISVSRIAKEKNLDLIIEVIEKLPDNYYLAVVGDGPYLKDLKKVAKKQKLDQKVRFIGRIPHDDIGVYYEAADIFLMPSTSETQGLTILEAQYFGTPCVVADCEVNREWICPDVGEISESSVDDFVTSINILVDIVDGSTEKILQNWAQLYSMESVTDNLIDKYEELIERKEISKKLTQFGWQSWSTSSKPFVKIPRWNYPPTKDRTIINKPNDFDSREQLKGWCSWYAYGRDIDEEKIIKNAQWLSENYEKLPLDYVLVDDGWCKWGDWSKADSERFPNGIKGLSERISQMGLKTGIWVSPFMCMTDSKFARDNPKWITKYMGRPINAFRVMHRLDSFSPFFRYQLDVKNPEVIEYLHQTINQLIGENNISLLKIDNVYTHYYHPGINNKEASWILHQFYKRIKEDNPELHLMGCGSPLKPAVGAVDSMRVGPDTFTPSAVPIPIAGRLFNSKKTKESVKKVRGMMWTQKYWNVDPDVFVCRSELNMTDRLIRYNLSMLKDVYENGGNFWMGDDLSQMKVDEFEKYGISEILKMETEK